ncbi:MAG TPA: 4Fe-4S dicluster domain-containing protein [Syntrophomonadaceae bacterium]|nr:4Fe-4S dicluster domain-containing protein [Syntrophomonadaceae bacterium]
MEGGEEPINGMSVAEKLAFNKYELNETSHIELNKEVCQNQCTKQVCLFICPAKVYTEKNGNIMVDHAGCLECGTCLVACTQKSLKWKYPDGGIGIIYRNG